MRIHPQMPLHIIQHQHHFLIHQLQEWNQNVCRVFEKLLLVSILFLHCSSIFCSSSLQLRSIWLQWHTQKPQFWKMSIKTLKSKGIVCNHAELFYWNRSFSQPIWNHLVLLCFQHHGLWGWRPLSYLHLWFSIQDDG
jgi:hypothetical protein